MASGSAQTAEALASRRVRRAMLRYASFPIILLLAILFIPLPFAFFHLLDYTLIMPDILFIGGVFVMAFGAFWDFGAGEYLREAGMNRMHVGEEDMNRIYRRQFLLMSMYIGIGFVYILSALIVLFL